MRPLFLILGCTSLVLAAIGAVVPGMPTTVFVLLAAFGFSRSSPRLEHWLRGHRWFGPPLARYASGHGLTRQAKREALVSMWLAVGLSAALLVPVSPAAAAGALALAAVGTVTILFGIRTASASTPRAAGGEREAGS